jgi:hypothetical protein
MASSQKISRRASWLISLILFLWLPLVHAATTVDSEEARQAAARRYLDVAQMSKILDDAQSEMAKTLPADQRERFRDFMRRAVNPEVLEKAAMESMVKIFTADEMNALADFFSSPTGKSAMGKFGLYMADLMPVIQQEIFRALQSMPLEDPQPKAQ